MSFLYIHDHAERLLGFLVSKFTNATRLRGLVQLAGEEIQCLEDAGWAMSGAQNIDGAVGVTLDLWGRILGAKREGLHDEPYRALLRAILLAARSQGGVTEVSSIFTLLMGAQTSLYYQHPGAGFSLWAVGHRQFTTRGQRRRARRIMTTTIPVGIKAHALVDAPDGRWGFADDLRASSWGAPLAEEISHDLS